MKVLYACNFNLSGYSGKDRATRQKLIALGLLVDELKVVSGGGWKFFDLFLIEFKCIYYLFFLRPDVFVSRGYIGLMSVLLCKLLNCKTFREIHADQIGEIKILNKNYFEKFILYVLGFYSVLIDRISNVRIFNHPQLKSWYDNKYFCGEHDFYCYNGFEFKEIKVPARDDILNKHNLDYYNRYLVFIGTASRWHGVEYLVEIQRELNKINSDLKIICAGGKVSLDIDPERYLVNLTPLNDEGCDELISIASACLLPVKNNRVSPGSPLKLYDYIKHGGFVVTQDNMQGYSDEVLKYGRGVCVDFLDAKYTADFLNRLEFDLPIITPIFDFSWNARMLSWIDVFKKTAN